MSSKFPADKAFVRNEVEKVLVKRFECLGIKPGSVAGGKEEAAFLAGASAALQALFGDADKLSDWVSPGWILYPLSGRSIVAEHLKKGAA